MSGDDSERIEAITPIHQSPVKRLTKEFLDTNFKKAELQKQCRELGFTKIWVTKDELIDMLLQQNSQPTKEVQDQNEENGQVNVQKMARDIENIYSKLDTKNMEIELLNQEIKTAYETIEALKRQVNELEQRNNSSRNGPQTQTGAPPSPHCLLLGDENLRRVSRSDLGEICSVKTINRASFDSLRSWITGKFNKAPSGCILYSGMNDILSESPHEKILDNLGALVSDLKEKNSNMKIYTVVPRYSTIIRSEVVVEHRFVRTPKQTAYR